MFKFNMGQTVAQSRSQYTGYVVARCETREYNTYQVRSPNLSTDGRPVEVWISEVDLVAAE